MLFAAGRGARACIAEGDLHVHHPNHSMLHCVPRAHAILKML